MKRGEGGLKRSADRGDVALTAHLGDEASMWIFFAECAVHAGEHRLMAGDSGDPVECGVGEDGVELLVVGQRGGVVMIQGEACGTVEASFARGGEHGVRGVDAGDDGASGGELLGEGSVATAEIENLFARLWGEESDHVGGESGDEAAVGGVGFGVPGLAGDGLSGISVSRHRVIVRHGESFDEEDKN